MKDSKNPFSAPEQSAGDTTGRPQRNIVPGMYLPTKIYEALPTAYMSVGTLFILGATYIGIGHGPAIAYLAVGLSCILAGVTVAGIRRKERSK